MEVASIIRNIFNCCILEHNATVLPFSEELYLYGPRQANKLLSNMRKMR